MPVTIKSVTSQQLAELQEISIATFDETFKAENSAEDMADYHRTANSQEQLAKELATPGAFFYFLYDNEELAGYLKVNVNEAQTEAKGPDYLEIQRVYIRQAFKRRGFGTLLLNKALTVAKEQGKSKVWLGVWEHNYKAQAFYETLAFKQTGAHDFWLGTDKQTDFILEQTLD